MDCTNQNLQPGLPKPGPGLTANQLKLLAMGLMLCDHLWATIIPGNRWMTLIGRMAFPIFAFQIAEGYCHTSNWKRYRKRLLLFALLAEIPFDLMYISAPVFPFHQNVMFTLLFGLMAIHALDTAMANPTPKAVALGIGQAALWVLLGAVLFVDYSWQGVLTVVCFWLCRQKAWEKPAQIVFLVLLNQVFFNGYYVEWSLLGHTIEVHTQLFALGALIPIWLYKGQKGRALPWLQWVGYSFYPAHMLLLYWLGVIL